MYAIIRTGGKQYRVEEGSLLRVERLPFAEGEEVQLDDVLLVSREEGILIPGKDAPAARVTARVLRQLKGPKIIVFKYKPKKGYHRKRGHRQLLTELRVESISVEGEEKAPLSENNDRIADEKADSSGT